MTQDNTDQVNYWNDRAGNTWAELQDRLDTLLKPLSDVGLNVASVQNGERILDVGCGCGDTSIALTVKGGRVQGIDISGPMLERARTRSSDVDFILADAANFAPEQPYDLIFSRFGVMFFNDPRDAFSNLHSMLNADGRLVFICWQPPTENPWMSVTGRAVAPFLPVIEPAPDPRDPGPFAFAETNYVRTILSDSGFKNIQFESFTTALRVGSNAEDALKLQTRVGPAARVMAEIKDDQRKQALDAALNALAAHQSDNGVQLDAAVWIVSATAS